jgi:hypothetical protein
MNTRLPGMSTSENIVTGEFSLFLLKMATLVHALSFLYWAVQDDFDGK